MAGESRRGFPLEFGREVLMIMQQTQPDYTASVIGAGAALLGALIGGLTAYWIDRQRIRHERERWVLERRQQAIAEFAAAAGLLFLVASDIVEKKRGPTAAEPAFTPLYTAHYAVALYATKAVRDISNQLIQSSLRLYYAVREVEPNMDEFNVAYEDCGRLINNFLTKAGSDLGF
jgi:hypothetical protein